jgi:hypothetical protein
MDDDESATVRQIASSALANPDGQDLRVLGVMPPREDRTERERL